jgi:hypothetical protein
MEVVQRLATELAGFSAWRFAQAARTARVSAAPAPENLGPSSGSSSSTAGLAAEMAIVRQEAAEQSAVVRALLLLLERACLSEPITFSAAAVLLAADEADVRRESTTQLAIACELLLRPAGPTLSSSRSPSSPVSWRTSHRPFAVWRSNCAISLIILHCLRLSSRPAWQFLPQRLVLPLRRILLGPSTSSASADRSVHEICRSRSSGFGFRHSPGQSCVLDLRARQVSWTTPTTNSAPAGLAFEHPPLRARSPKPLPVEPLSSARAAHDPRDPVRLNFSVARVATRLLPSAPRDP